MAFARSLACLPTAEKFNPNFSVVFHRFYYYRKITVTRQSNRTSNQHIKNLHNNMNDAKKKEFDKFRHEVYKLGLSGLEKKEQIDARYEQAIKLGAKPKKWIKPPNNGPAKKTN